MIAPNQIRDFHSYWCYDFLKGTVSSNHILFLRKSVLYFKGKETKRSSHVKGKQLDSSNDLVEHDNPFSFTNFVKKDAALKSGGRVLQVREILDKNFGKYNMHI